MKPIPNAINPEVIIERCELFTRDHLSELARELNACKKGAPMDEDGKLKELYLKLSMAGKLPAPPMQIAIAMISNECVNYCASLIAVADEGEAT